MYYHTCVLHLFRPFLKVDLTKSPVSPREICTSCANSIASLLMTYRRTYGLRRIPPLATNILLTSAIIHLLNLPSSSQALAASISGLREISTVHAFAKRCLGIITALAKQWKIQLPAEVSRAAHDPSIASTKDMVDGTPNSQNTETYRLPLSGHVQQGGNAYSTAIAGDLPFTAMKNSPHSSSTSVDLFWSPFQNQSLPLQANHRADPMDIAAMLDVPNNDCDQLNRDGFRAASTNEAKMGASAFTHGDDQWTPPDSGP